ncbi:MAG: metallophosphoesterase [Candidatus Rehaiarchaeum fermentans]|nr:metallophosphoesterase [Candidatus Rehaiarchaeum fermentans]MCW1297467.1 metallophosphoesterase [Candidatus Rehaiarchaeum fermentans]MCW1302309.1 metallophosphoesterase [Candidatus Rehaiarchaeum fermentans]
MDIEDFPFKFFAGKRYFSYNDYAVIGDLHFGKVKGIEERAKDEFLIKEIISIPFDKLIILGDVRTDFLPSKIAEKHYLQKLFKKITENKQIFLVKGNHDSLVYKVISDVIITRKLIIDNIGFIHGHFIPEKSFIEKIDYLVMAHLHPSFSYYDSNKVKYVEDCWEFGAMKIYKKEIGYLIVPKFNFFEGGAEENENKGILKFISSRQRMTLNLQVID